MRSFREIQAIMRDYPPAPDEEDLRRLCARHMERISQPHDITDWIDHVDNPYLRELYATQTAIMVKEHCTSDWPDEVWNLPQYLLDEITEKLALMANQAFGSQIGECFYYAERFAYTKPQQEAVVQAMPYYQEVKEKLDIYGQRIDKIEQKLEGPHIDMPHWPYFTSKATEEDKHTFENFLLKLCSKEMKGISREIKNYLELKQKAGIIARPESAAIEIEALRLFGYKAPEKTYYNA